MELPKNVTQIGEANHNCKIYVEDYVISYMKQLNCLAANKEMAAALYGVRKVEAEVTYLFLYGAGKLDFLQREVRHLSQAQMQEIENVRKKYFSGYDFQGYCLLNGEMVEGFYVCEQEICRYIAGYAQFYEKNDSMLAYMLDTRQTEAAVEEVNQEKYEMVRKRQEERRSERHHEEKKNPMSKSETDLAAMKKMRKMKFSTAAAFTVLGVMGLAALGRGGNLEQLKQTAGNVVNNLTEQKLPDVEAVSGQKIQVNTLVAEDKLAEALQDENAASEESALQQEEAVMTSAAMQEETEVMPQETVQTAETAVSWEMEQTAVQAVTEETMQAGEEETADRSVEETAEEAAQTSPTIPTAYIIREGDTLIRISIAHYGSDERVREICDLNGISNADDIKIGQKILLPQ